jgi:hypothetical protein
VRLGAAAQSTGLASQLGALAAGRRSRGPLACLGLLLALGPRRSALAASDVSAAVAPLVTGLGCRHLRTTCAPPPLPIQALAGYEVTVRGETSVPRAELANLLFAAGAAVRVSRDAGAAAVEVHRTRDRQRIAASSHGRNAPLGQGPGSARPEVTLPPPHGAPRTRPSLGLGP